MSAGVNTFIARYGVAILYFAVSLLIGVILDQALGRFLHSESLRRLSRLLSAVLRSLHGIISWAFGLVGLWLAFWQLPKFSWGEPDATGTLAMIFAKGADYALIFGWRVRTASVLHWLTVATLLVTTVFLARIAGRFITLYTASDSTRIPAGSIFTNLVKAIIYIIGFALILSQLGVSITPIITTLGIGGVAIGLALQPTLGNLFAGIQIVTSHQIEPGDFVRLASGDEGTVEDVTWSNTTIRKITSELVIVPNSVLGKEPVINFSRNNYQHTLVIPGTVALNTDVEQLERVVREVADDVMRSSHYTYKAASPNFRLTGTAPSGISFNTILPIISYRSEPVVKSEFIEHLMERFEAEGIELARPVTATVIPPGIGAPPQTPPASSPK